MAEWFEEWFGEEYLELYPHRDSVDAERMVALLVRTLPWSEGWRVLDAACGAGRHMVALERAGAIPFGFDLSGPLLRRARSVTLRPIVRADLRRLPFRDASMDLTVNLFTSFGYFATDGEHAAALGQMLATVRPRGWFVIDFLNADHVRQTLIPYETTTAGSGTIEVHRALTSDGHYVRKSIVLGNGRRFEERVRLLEAGDLQRMLAAHGATVTTRLGDYDGAPLGQGPRTILMAQVAG